MSNNLLTIADINMMTKADLIDLIKDNQLDIESKGMKVGELKAAIIEISGLTEAEGDPGEATPEAKPSGRVAKIWLNPACPPFLKRCKILDPPQKLFGNVTSFFQVPREECLDGYTPPTKELREWLLEQQTPGSIFYFQEDKPRERADAVSSPLMG